MPNRSYGVVVLALAICACADRQPVAPESPAAPQFDHATADGSLPDFALADGILCLLEAGAITCSGSQGFSSTIVTPAGNDFVEIAISYFGHVLCGIRQSGAIACSGNTVPQLLQPPGGQFTAISMSVGTACAIRTDGTLACWGESPGTPAGTFLKIRGGLSGFCGIRTDQTLTCWGSIYPVPSSLASTTFIDVSPTGRDSNCALKSDGAIVCFAGETLTTPLPGTYTRFVSDNYITPGPDICGQKADGTLDCSTARWLGIPSTPFSAIASSIYAMCGVTQGKLACWGQDFRRSGKFALSSAPRIAIGGPYNIKQGETVTLNASGTTDPDGDAMTFEWELRRDNLPSGTGAIYTTPVLYRSVPIALTVSDGLSRIWVEGNIIVTDVAPTMTLAAPATVTPGSTFTLAATNVYDPSPTDLANVRFQYDCGTGQLRTTTVGVLSAVCTAPAVPGTINVRARVLANTPPSPILFSPFQLATITVSSNNPPSAAFSAPASVAEGSSIALAISSVVDENVGSVQYAFDCGEGYGAYGSLSTASCATADDGSRTVRAKLKDDGGLETEYSSVVTITDVVPVVNAITGATIMAGETYAGAGTFSGAAVDQFTATVDFGSGAQSLSLNGYGFTLSHQYAVAGTYLVAVTVSDDDGSSSSVHATVVVQNAQQAATALSETITDLISSGVLTEGAANAMTSSLSAAAAQYSNGNTTAGNNQMNAFIRQVEAQMRSGRLSSINGNALIDYANRIRASGAS